MKLTPLILLLAISASAATCGIGTLASYAGTTCTQNEVTYVFPQDFYKQSGSFLIKPSEVTVRIDPNGPYTLLIGSTRWTVGNGQVLHTVLHFKVSGARTVNAWAHDAFATGDGSGYATQIVAVNPQIDAAATWKQGSSSEPQGGARYITPNANPVQVDQLLVVHLAGGDKGASKLRSVGIHEHP